MFKEQKPTLKSTDILPLEDRLDYVTDESGESALSWYLYDYGKGKLVEEKDDYFVKLHKALEAAEADFNLMMEAWRDSEAENDYDMLRDAYDVACRDRENLRNINQGLIGLLKIYLPEDVDPLTLLVDEKSDANQTD